MKSRKEISKDVGIEGIFVRDRINMLLELSLSKPAAFVMAEAGFGKTKAVTSFLAQTNYKRVWQQLTMLDNLPIRFWESFVSVISLHRPKLGKKLASFGFPFSLSDFHYFLKLFTKELYEDDQFVIFVFDDYHYIDNINIKTFFQRFIAADLENICLFFLTRKKDEPMYSNKISKITTEDLRFTKEEMQGYFKHRGIDFHDRFEREDVYTFTNGWGIALYLVSLQMQKNHISEESYKLDSEQLIFQLIEREIFANYSEQDKQFMLMLSELSFFPREMLNMLGEFLNVNTEAIVQNNSFIAFDVEADSYYFHQLFLDFLIKKRKGVKLSKLFLEKAGEWCLENGYFVDAIFYFEKGKNETKIVEAIRSLRGIRYSKEEAESLLSYIETLSGNFKEQPMVYELTNAMLLLNNLRVQEAKERLDKIKAYLKQSEETPENKELFGETLIGEGLIFMSLGNKQFVSKFKKALEVLPEGSKNWSHSLHIVEFSSALYVNKAKTGEANQWVEALFEGIPYLSKLLCGAGVGMEYLARGEYHFLCGAYKKAQEDAYEALFKSKAEKQMDIADNALFLLLRIFLATGKTAELYEIVEQLEQRDAEYYRHRMGVPDVALGWFYSEIGQISKVAPWILDEANMEQPPISVDRNALLCLRCLIEKENEYKALALSRQIVSTFDKRNKITSKIYILVYNAIILYHTKEIEKAGEALEQAYALASPDKMIMPFVEFGHKTRAVLGYFCTSGLEGISKESLDNLYKKASTYAKRRAYLASSVKKKEGVNYTDYGLSSREKELLSHLSQGLNRDEMAASMYVSPHTIKSMLKTIYNKMGAINAADAVRLAGISKLIT